MWIEVDFPTFADARTLAEKDGTLLRSSEPGSIGFLAENGASPEDLFAPIDGASPRYGAFLTAGLYRGVFRYQLDPNRAFVWGPGARKTQPLQRWGASEMVDVAVSYSSEDRGTLALPFLELLRHGGVSVYAVDVAAEPDGPIWRLRYREGLMHSRFFVPVLTPCYLARSGTQDELADIAKMTVEHRSTEHFYPLLPWRPAAHDAAEIRGAWAGRGRENEANWLLSHVFPLPATWEPSMAATFIRSLSRAARAVEQGQPTNEVAYLLALAPMISSAERPDLDPNDPKWTVKITVRHPWWEGRHYELLLRETGRIRWVGLGEIDGSASAEPFDDVVLALAGYARPGPTRRLDGHPVGVRFWLAAEYHLRAGRFQLAAYEVACALRAGFDNATWLILAGRIWFAFGDAPRAGAAWSAALERLTADRRAPLAEVVMAMLDRVGEVIPDPARSYADLGPTLQTMRLDDFGFDSHSSMFADPPALGLRLSGDCLGVKDFFELAGELVTCGHVAQAVAVMESCVNYAQAPTVKARALYMAAKTLLLSDTTSAKGSHYARLAFALFPDIGAQL